METSLLIDDLLKNGDAYDSTSPLRSEKQPLRSSLNVARAKQRNQPTAWGQLLATIKRQVLQKVRAPFSLLLEIILPIVFVLGLVGGNAATNTTVQPGTQFLRPASTSPVYQGTGPTSLAAQPMVGVKERFCYNGSMLNFSEVQRAVFGGNCSDGLLKCNSGRGPQQCHGELVCTDNFADFGIPPGFCFYYDSVPFIRQFLMFNGPTFLHDLDSYLLMQWALIIDNDGPNTDPFDQKSYVMGGPIGFTPDTPETSQLIQMLNTTFSLFRFVAGKTWPSRAAAMNFFTSMAGEGQWALVELLEMSPSALRFSLAFNRSAVPFTTTVLARFSGGLASTRFRDYVNSGFITVQRIISEVYLTKYLNVSSAVLTDSPVVIAPMGYAEYRSSAFLQIAGSALAPLTLVLSFLYTVSQVSKRLVEEKELRLREGMMVMGLQKFAFYSSWIITYFAQMLVASVLITIVIKVGLIRQSDPTLIFVLYFLFGVSTVLLAAFLSSFFSKSRITALVVPLLYFGLSIPSFSLPEGTSRGTYTILSLFSPTAFGIGTRLLFSYEVNDGMGWGDLRNAADTVNMGSVIGLLLFDCILYFLLTLYLDEVFPSEWGSKRHPCFCCCLCCSESNKDAIAIDRVLNATAPQPPKGRGGEVMEEYPHSLDERGNTQACTVHLQMLRKEFTLDDTVKVAVNDLDLKIFPDQITVLLGHNGAGKTTTMNMITGMLPITSGDVVVYGKSVKHELRDVRNEIGFCPQHNILWGNLTCAEHLRYFASLKGVPSEDIEAQVDEILLKVDLQEKKDTFSDQLSGGQKRKLSVAIAFIGGSRLILLDEPTAGMDVAARRHTWDLLKEMSIGRTIVLTTHFMDEADLLGNRIAIMSRGALHSYGSPMFLKARLGTGYVLRVSLTPDGAAAPGTTERLVGEILQLIHNSIPDAAIKEVKGQEVAIALPMSAAAKFASTMVTLEDRSVQQRLHIAGLSMSVSTLEDVFVRIAEEEDMGISPGQSPAAGEPNSPSKTAQEATRLLEDVYQRMEARPCQVTFSRQFAGLLLKRFHNARRDRRTIVLQIVLPVLCILLAMALTKLGPPDSPLLWINDKMYSTTQVTPYTGTACNGLSTLFDTSSTPLYIPTDYASGNQSYNFSKILVDQFKSHGGTDRMMGFSCNDDGFNSTYAIRNNTGVIRVPAATVVLFNATGIHSLPQALGAYYNALAGYYTFSPGKAQNTTIQIATYPMPWTASQAATISGIQNLLAGIFILIPFTFIPSTYVSWIVKERSSKAKHLQVVSGVHYLAYWGSNFVFDVVSFFITELLALVIFAAFKREEYIGSNTIGGTLLLFILYGISGITSAYFFSFLFDNHSSAQNITMLANFIAGFALVITMFVLSALPSTTNIASILVFFCRVIPSYCLGEGILNLASILVGQQTGFYASIWDMDQLGWDLVYLSVEAIGFSVATLLWDHPQRQLRKQQLLFDRNAQAPDISDEDVDVQRERREVEGATRANDVVVVKKLRKVYENGKVAVQNVTFGVKQGEVFGFLGTNGAGKTTTMSILTSEFLPSMGSCTVGGFDVIEQAAEAQRIMGYCPQFDAVIDLLTCEEHLYLYAALRGVSVQDTPIVVDALLKVCDINNYRAVPSKKLSGGNKRKLSVAISLIGAPKLVLLDEPSAGMDPHARRLMWDVINFVARRSSVVLTTHHLEEVDVLAHRVGIMVDGTLRCLGSLDHLKRKFGSGYEVCVKANNSSSLMTVAGDALNEEERIVQRISSFFEGKFPSSKLLENRNLRLTFAVPNNNCNTNSNGKSSTVTLSHIFRTLQQAKDAQTIPIAEYTVQQASLEQVFLRISEGMHAQADEEGLRQSIAEVSNDEPWRESITNPTTAADISFAAFVPPRQSARHSRTALDSANDGDVFLRLL